MRYKFKYTSENDVISYPIMSYHKSQLSFIDPSPIVITILFSKTELLLFRCLLEKANPEVFNNITRCLLSAAIIIIINYYADVAIIARNDYFGLCDELESRCAVRDY